MPFFTYVRIRENKFPQNLKNFGVGLQPRKFPSAKFLPIKYFMYFHSTTFMGNNFFNKNVNDIIPQTKFGNLVVKVSLSANFISKATIKLFIFNA